MKPNIDLSSPLVKLFLALQEKEMRRAYEMEQTVEKAVIPIFSVPSSKAHNARKTKPEQSGTGVLVHIENEFFIFSATHVFQDFEGKSVLTAPPGLKPVEELTGERLSSVTKDIRPVDEYDAAVFHIQNSLSDSLKEIAVSIENMDLNGFDEESPVFMITGFRAKKSNTSGNQIKTKAENFPTAEIKEYEDYGYDKVSQIILAYENQALVNNQWRTTPTPRGMSGGAIIKAQGTSLGFNKKNGQQKKEEKQLLTAITIEQHKDNGKKLGYLLGTRVTVHLGLIYKFLPDLRETLDRHIK